MSVRPTTPLRRILTASGALLATIGLGLTSVKRLRELR